MRRIGSYEAKTHLPRLLDEVARGEIITITKHGVPVAVLVPPVESGTVGVREAAAGLRAFRSTHGLRGLTIRELIDEGRR
jgi:prevent-host-death family protein